MNAAIWGLLGTAIGALASIGTAWVAAQSSSQREREKLSAERSERAHAFQRQTLVDLQEAIHDSMRLVHRAHLEDKHSAAQGKAWDKAILSNSLDEELRSKNRWVAILTERVADEKLRTQVKQLMQISTRALLAKSEQESFANLEQAGNAGVQVLEAVGENLRQHYR